MNVKLSALLKNIKNDLEKDVIVSHISDDSRTIKKDSVFLAYPGLTQDGRDYIDSAIENGALVILFEENNAVIKKNPSVEFIPIKNLKDKVPLIASRFYGNPSHDVTVIGITGTNGKTSCSHFIANALSEENKKIGVLGTLGNGVWPNIKSSTHTTLMPLHLQEVLFELKNKKVSTVSMEVSSHALQQGRVDQLEFDIAVFTNLSQDHLDYHGDMKTYASVKEKLFQMPGLKKAVINADDDFGLELIERYQHKLEVVSYSLQQKNYPRVYAENIESTTCGYNVSVVTPWGKGEFQTKLLGRFNISNLLAVLSTLGLMGMPLKTILNRLSRLNSANGRLQFFTKERQPTVVVDYAHTPDALEKALSALREHCAGKIWCVVGCGGDRDKTKRSKMAAVAEQKADHIVFTNDNPRSEDPKVIIQNMCEGMRDSARVNIIFDRKDAIHNAIATAGINDLILIAGKGHETTQTIGKVVYPFNDAEVVKKYLGID